MKKEKNQAWGQICSACKGRNHLKSTYKNVHSLRTDDSDSDDDPWLDVAKANSSDKVVANMIVNECERQFQIDSNECEVQFQIDSGAQVNTICQKYVKKKQARKSSTKLRMWNKTSMDSLGETTLTMKKPRSGEHEVNLS